jgi:hypothetical protein
VQALPAGHLIVRVLVELLRTCRKRSLRLTHGAQDPFVAENLRGPTGTW